MSLYPHGNQALPSPIDGAKCYTETLDPTQKLVLAVIMKRSDRVIGLTLTDSNDQTKSYGLTTDLDVEQKTVIFPEGFQPLGFLGTSSDVIHSLGFVTVSRTCGKESDAGSGTGSKLLTPDKKTVPKERGLVYIVLVGIGLAVILIAVIVVAVVLVKQTKGSLDKLKEKEDT